MSVVREIVQVGSYLSCIDVYRYRAVRCMGATRCYHNKARGYDTVEFSTVARNAQRSAPGAYSRRITHVLYTRRGHTYSLSTVRDPPLEFSLGHIEFYNFL